jgi:hypothetical protein
MGGFHYRRLLLLGESGMETGVGIGSGPKLFFLLISYMLFFRQEFIDSAITDGG